MQKQPLLPSSFRPVGWILFGLSMVGGLYWLTIGEQVEPAWLDWNVFSLYGDPGPLFGDTGPDRNYWLWNTNNVLDEIIAFSILLGGIMVGFSREKIEDELTSQIRLNALLWSVHVALLLTAVAIVFTYGSGFFLFMIINLFLLLIVFIARYQYLIRKYRRI